MTRHEYWLVNEQPKIISGPSGKIQAGYSSGKGSVGIVICHPHPQHGGTMFNKVVTTVVQAARKIDMPVVRFNYRGVGASAGSYGHGVGEVDDAAAVCQWVKASGKIKEIWIVGFSFGAAVAYTLHYKIPCRGVILICPNVQNMKHTPKRHAPIFVIQAQQDEIICASSAIAWARDAQADQIYQIESSHFFHGKLLDLQAVVRKILLQ